jgi:hypothetical protein
MQSASADARGTPDFLRFLRLGIANFNLIRYTAAAPCPWAYPFRFQNFPQNRRIENSLPKPELYKAGRRAYSVTVRNKNAK